MKGKFLRHTEVEYGGGESVSENGVAASIEKMWPHFGGGAGKGDGGAGVFHGGSLVKLVRIVEWDLNFFWVYGV